MAPDEEVPMSVAKVIEITASSPTSFAEAARAGVAKAAETVHGIQRASGPVIPSHAMLLQT